MRTRNSRVNPTPEQKVALRGVRAVTCGELLGVGEGGGDGIAHGTPSLLPASIPSERRALVDEGHLGLRV